MDPNQPHPPVNGEQQPAPAANPYSFITDTQHHPKKPLIASGSFRSRLLVIVGGGIGLIILVILISQFAFGNKSSNGKLLTTLAAEQQEIARIAAVGAVSATDAEVQSFAATTSLTTSSQKAALTGYLKTKKVKFTAVSLAAKKSSTTDATLADAKAKNNFDTVFMTVIRKLLTDYAADVKTNYNNASNKTSKTLLADTYNSTATLLKQ